MVIMWLGVFAIIAILAVLKKKFLQTLMRFQFLMNIIASVLSIFLVAYTIIGAYQVVNSDMNIADKLLFLLFTIAYAAIFVWSNYRFWKEWFRKDKSNKS